MRRREFILALGGAAASSLAARAQQAGRIWRIGQVLAGTADSAGHLARAFEQRLTDIGYRIGENPVLITRFVTPQPQLMEDVIRSLIKDIDLLVTWGTVTSVAARKVTRDIPVVFVSVGAPVEIGLVESLAHPGGNLTGVTFEAAAQTYAKRMQLLKEAIPRLARIAVLGARDDANFSFAIQSVEKVAPTLGVATTVFDFRPDDSLATKFAEMRKQGIEGLIEIAGVRTYTHRQEIVELALYSHLPSCHGFVESVMAGGLVGLGPDFGELARQGADYVDKIIRGAKPAELPVQQPTRYLLFVNLRTARRLGLSLPESLIARADEVIE